MKKYLLILLFLLLPSLGLAECWIEKNPDRSDTFLVCWHEIDLYVDREGDARGVKNIYCDIYGPNLKALGQGLKTCNKERE